ncbi:putative glycosyltransferase [Calothrix sp. NIES-4101]|nr:putative glycosyltransferase [Calothrix sp. NIES-4101]
MNKIYIILPVHNRRDITLNFVGCLKVQRYQNYQLILIDDGSTDGTEEAVKNELSSTVIIKGKGNWWWAGGLQQGINWLKNNSINSHDIVLMINDDVTFDKFFLEKAVKILEDKQHSLLLAQSFGKQTGLPVNIGVKADMKALTFKQTFCEGEINCLATMGLFLRFADLLTIGNFYPNILPHYLSDYEFTIRAHQKGLKLCIHPELNIYVNEDTTGYSDLKKSKFIDFIKKYFSHKSMNNPMAWTAFIILSCPPKWIIFNIARIWKRSISTIFNHALNTVFYQRDEKSNISA